MEHSGESGQFDIATHLDKVKAEFHALSYTLGPFGRQDIHLHPRIDRESRVDVLVGFGRTCDPKRLHAQMRQTTGSTWWKQGHEGESLDGPGGKTPKPAQVAAHIGGDDRDG
jgi:hypothetical protein